jgi:hypothetical protein
MFANPFVKSKAELVAARLELVAQCLTNMLRIKHAPSCKRTKAIASSLA